MIQLQVPAWGTIDMGAAALSSAALIAMLRYRVRIGWTLGSCALLGGTYRLLI
jgi:hypothetical protein